jgi:hypothetical protein
LGIIGAYAKVDTASIFKVIIGKAGRLAMLASPGVVLLFFLTVILIFWQHFIP